MSTRRSLRLRVALSFALFSMSLLVAFVVAVGLFVEVQEDGFAAEALDAELRRVREALREQPGRLPPSDDRFAVYLVQGPADRAALPDHLQSLVAGDAEIDTATAEYHVRVEPVGDALLFLSYDVTPHERRVAAFRSFLDAGLIVAVTVSAWLAFALAGQLARPLRDLARDVGRLDPAAPRTSFAAGYRDHEVVQLAEAFDAYHQRAADAIAREAEFTATVSHELRTPLTAIRTSAELLSQDVNVSVKARERAEGVLRAAGRMADAIESLLLLARETPVEAIQPVALRPLAEAAVAAVAEEVRTGVGVQIGVPEGAVVSTCAPALKLALINLLRNAAAYTTQGRIEVVSDDAAIVIRDTGVGIPHEDLPYVFDRLYRGSNASGSGSGLGLAIVRRMADRFGWQVSVDSRPGSGTEFRLVIPQPSQKLHAS